MGRPARRDVDYFPFYAKRGKTLNILQSKYGLEGIGFFTNLMRFLALTPDHYYCIKEEDDKLNFFAEIGLPDEERGIAMIELMVKTGKLDKKLWEEHKVIACEAFLESIKDAYERRNNQIITIDEIREKFEKRVIVCGSNGNEYNNPTESELGGVSVYENTEFGDNNPQTILENTKLNNTKKYSCGSDEPPDKQSKHEPDPDQDPPNPQSFPAANAAEPETAMVLHKNSVARSPPKKKQELSDKELVLFHAAKACFESCEKTKAMLYQDRETTAREMKHLKTLVIRCSNIAPEMTADFLQNILEHFKVMTNGKLKGKVVFTPRALITPWIWELVIDSLPENNVTPELQEIIRGLFQ